MIKAALPAGERPQHKQGQSAPRCRCSSNKKEANSSRKEAAKRLLVARREDKSGSGTNFQTNCYLAEAALPDRQIQEAMTLNRCKQAVSALKFCY